MPFLWFFEDHQGDFLGSYFLGIRVQVVGGQNVVLYVGVVVAKQTKKIIPF